MSSTLDVSFAAVSPARQKSTPRRRDGTLSLILIGAGRVGSALLEQIAEHPLAASGRLRISAIANSRRWLWSKQGLQLSGWEEKLRKSADRTDVDELVQLAWNLRGANVAIVDCTASNEVVDTYSRFI